MRIAYLNDLHLEFESGTGRQAEAPPIFDAAAALSEAADADLIVLAGDIDAGERGIAQADQIAIATEKPVVYVAGNHEAYGHDLAVLEPKLRQAAWATDGRVLFLNGNVARFWFGGTPLVVLGCTLWTDYKLGGGHNAHEAEFRIQDHQHILWNSGHFLPSHAQALHFEQRAWLDAQMQKLAVEAAPPHILVVTHHAPIPEALGMRGAIFAPAYASDLRPEIAGWPKLAWVHGHTHHRHETRIGESIVVSAPRGYAVPGNDLSGYRCGILDI